jgi:hypothetical protein
MNLLASFSLLITLLAPFVQSWGEIGHRAVGYLAQKHLNPAGLALFNELIKSDAKFDISDGAVWADLQTWRWPYTKPWHYIDAKDNPPRTCKVNYNADCPKDQGCIVSAIKNMTARVNDASLSQEEQSNALKFLLHFVGDIHQPLHTEDTCRGGNGIMVHWGRREVKLHGVWDKEIIHKLLKYKKPTGPDPDNVYDKFLANGWATTLYEDSALNVGHADIAAECTDVTTPEKCAVKWATEANKFICSYVLKDGTNNARAKEEDNCHWNWSGPDDVSLEYYEGAVPIVESQIKRAGMRLGAWVNGLAAERAAVMKAGLEGGGHLKVQGGEWEL